MEFRCRLLNVRIRLPTSVFGIIAVGISLQIAERTNSLFPLGSYWIPIKRLEKNMAGGIGLTIHVAAISVIVLLGMSPKIFGAGGTA